MSLKLSNNMKSMSPENASPLLSVPWTAICTTRLVEGMTVAVTEPELLATL